ncbi:hypothetical protein CI610_03604 [invertebrate metagenome]|uniref:Uncharacterized protein n=1 Tax=invertebrate metagenome TaxID=1711999 RepID=A0A2H9T2M8_9ZZZZ
MCYCYLSVNFFGLSDNVFLCTCVQQTSREFNSPTYNIDSYKKKLSDHEWLTTRGILSNLIFTILIAHDHISSGLVNSRKNILIYESS